MDERKGYGPSHFLLQVYAYGATWDVIVTAWHRCGHILGLTSSRADSTAEAAATRKEETVASEVYKWIVVHKNRSEALTIFYLLPLVIVFGGSLHIYYYTVI